MIGRAGLYAVLVFGGWHTALAGNLGFPLACAPGQTCFVQQYPDMDPGPGMVDPFCGTATYNGHDGTDIRVLSLRDMAAGVPVLAIGDGTVLRGRDGMADRLVLTDADAKAIANRECGNGLVIDLGGGLEAQYCHLRQGSLLVKPGDHVSKGEQLGLVGASGLAQFPHVHVGITLNGVMVDPSTGRNQAEGCALNPDPGQSLWDAQAQANFSAQTTQVLSAGFSGGAVNYDRLVIDGPPAEPAAGASALVAWAWFIDLDKGDVITISLSGADGAVIADLRSDPLDRAKAGYSAFTGRRMTVIPGQYHMQVRVLRGDKPIIDQSRELVVK